MVGFHCILISFSSFLSFFLGLNTRYSIHRKSIDGITDDCPRLTPCSTGKHYGTKPGYFETSIIHCPTREGVSEVSERTSERTSEWPSTYVFILVCFRPQWSDKQTKSHSDNDVGRWNLAVTKLTPASSAKHPYWRRCTMVQNSLKMRRLHSFTFPRAWEWVNKRASEWMRSVKRSEARKQCKASEWESSASEQNHGQYLRLESWLSWIIVHWH